MSHGAFTLADVDQAAPPPQTAGRFTAADLDGPPKPASAASRLGTNFLSGLGVTSNDQAKRFFAHPLDTVIKSFEAQGELAKKARDAYDRGDYVEALQHGLNYLVPFIGQQTDQAGEQLKEGDIAGGVGRTLGAAVPIVAGSPDVQAAAGTAARTAADTGATVVRSATRRANTALAKAPGTVGATAGGAVGAMTHLPYAAEVGAGLGAVVGKEVLPQVRIPGEGFGLPSRVQGGPAAAPEFQAPAAAAARQSPDLPEAFQPPAPKAQPPVGSVDNPFQAPERAAAAPAPDAPVAPTAPAVKAEPTAAAQSPNLETPRTLSGESALQKILAGQDNANLLKIARSRGINVTREAQLRPGIADDLLVKKIVEDFSDDELNNVRDTYLENQRVRGNVGDAHPGIWNKVGPEANKTLAMQTYFPEVKLPSAAVRRTQSAVTSARSIVTDPATGQPEFSDVLAAKQAKPAAVKASPVTTATPAPKTTAAAAGGDDLTAQVQASIDAVKAQPGGVFTTAEPGVLTKRWGVDESAIADTDANVRGMNAKQSQAYINKLAKSYKTGQPVEPVLETRDVANNVISVDGRHRALAAAKAGVERIPIIVRRVGVQ